MTGELGGGGAVRGGPVPPHVLWTTAGCRSEEGSQQPGGPFPDQTTRGDVLLLPDGLAPFLGRCCQPQKGAGRSMAGINAPLLQVLPGSALLKVLPVALMWRKCQRGSTLRVLFQ